MTKKQNNNWRERFELLVRQYLYIDPLDLDHWEMIAKKFGENCPVCGKLMVPNKYADEFEKKLQKLVKSEIDKAVEDKILEISKIIDRNTVDGMYSPDGIAQDLITFIGAEAIKKHLSINKKETK